MTFPGCRWASGTCKLQRECTFAHGEKELEAWNEHLEKMEKERKMNTKEGKEEKTTDGHPKSSSNKVYYNYGIRPRVITSPLFMSQVGPSVLMKAVIICIPMFTDALDQFRSKREEKFKCFC